MRLSRPALAALACAALPAIADEPRLRPDDERRASISGQAFSFPLAAKSGEAALPVTAAISGDTRAVLATLLHRGWSLHLHFGG